MSIILFAMSVFHVHRCNHDYNHDSINDFRTTKHFIDIHGEMTGEIQFEEKLN